MNKNQYIPISPLEIKEKGYNELDVIIISADAYVDHPSFGTAIIARYLEKYDFKVGIIAQPDWRNKTDFLKLGKPRLCYAVTAGNMDSLVGNRTGTKKRRKTDAYSPGGKPGCRPDRAVIVYCNIVRQISKDIPLVIGGIEASLRRLAHYDYWTDSLRRSILLDSKADILVYGMGEKTMLNIVTQLKNKSLDLTSLPGIAYMSSTLPAVCEKFPSYNDLTDDKILYAKAHKQFATYYLKRPSHPIVQQYQNRWLIHNHPGAPLTTKEMDEIYALPFIRKYHPVYKKSGGIPALETVKFSITSHRGCFGGCSFCALFLHQGHIIQSRSEQSILNEVRLIAKDPAFKGYITDIGGPTANMYGLSCVFHKKSTHCLKRDCLGTEPCPNLNNDHTKYLTVLKKASQIPKVKKIFISTGIRYDLFPDNKAFDILSKICENHISGQMKIAPEHIVAEVLRLMKKPSKEKYLNFLNLFKRVTYKLKLKQFVIPYFISAHPGCTEKHMLELALFLRKQNFIPDQIQDFLPTPMTASTCMYYTGINPDSGEKIYVARSDKEKQTQRKILHFHKPQNRALFKKLLDKYGMK
ncbi:YgiQ family radical SAM protein [bacterium]|nr:YgiQ family radical SAM protein [bacterium]